MEITDVKVKLVGDRNDKLLAFCTITIHNDFVIRDLKIIDGPKGAFVAMPSRKLTDRCQRCGGKNHRLAKFCNGCGAKLSDSRPRRGDGGRARLHADIAHPITSDCREFVQRQVLDAYREELEQSKKEGYVPPDLDADFPEDAGEDGVGARPEKAREPAEAAEVAPSAPEPDDGGAREPEPERAEPARARRPERKKAPRHRPPERPKPERKEPPPPPPSEESEDNFSSGIFR